MIATSKRVEGVMEFISLGYQRHNASFAIDGVVIKVNRYDQQEKLGMTSQKSRWAISYKFETEGFDKAG